ncbi:MAG: DNA-3-methyladenine glycosylase I [Alphaproteobacteria bacterium]|nr:DNA-3-methyladenine glycosylase I [Alphaproteobacteria bacterium]
MRCSWVDLKDNEYIAYHDHEWGIPVHDDRLLFEMLVLEGFQAGLSWQCVLHKRKNFRLVFDNFDAKKVAVYDEKKVVQLIQNKGLIRHKLKIQSAIKNAKIFLKIQEEFGSFSAYIWGWTKGKVIRVDSTQTRSTLSDQISKDLKKRGMSFVGTTIMYSYLCAIGIINAHEKGCDFYQSNTF